jgi:hypothetical protein
VPSVGHLAAFRLCLWPRDLWRPRFKSVTTDQGAATYAEYRRQKASGSAGRGFLPRTSFDFIRSRLLNALDVIEKSKARAVGLESDISALVTPQPNLAVGAGMAQSRV